jgi:exo-1,4-beta-D-glucosaminidase
MDGTRIFIPSSHEQPKWSAIDINTFSLGPWHMVRLPIYYSLYDTMQTFQSKNEIGLPSVPPINNLAASVPDFNEPWDEFFPLNKTMSYHDAVGGGNGGFNRYLKIMHEDIGIPSSIAELLKWGDLYSNQVYRTIFEAANRARPRNNLTILWNTNAAWLSFMWQIYDWYLRPNAGYYTMKSAIKPIHVQYSHIDKGIQVVSTLDKDVNVKINVSVISADGTEKAEKSYAAGIFANKTVYIDSLPDIINDTSLYFVALDLFDESDQIIDRMVTWTQKNSKWQDLLKIPATNVKCTLLGKEEVKGETEYTFEVINESDFPAVNIMLEITNGAFGKEILPAFWDDNALTMMPGESKKVKVKVRNDLIPNTPFVLAEGFNVNPASWDIAAGSKDTIDITIENLKIKAKADTAYLHFTASQLENIGTRITTHPVKLSIDGKLYRYVSVATKQGMDIIGKIELLDLAPGKHEIQMGNFSKTINY